MFFSLVALLKPQCKRHPEQSEIGLDTPERPLVEEGEGGGVNYFWFIFFSLIRLIE